MKVLWVVTARAGSKGIPNKNIKPLAGMPLMGYRIKSALAIANPEDVIVSTDSEQYATIARSLGATVPYLRSAKLADDQAKSDDVMMEALNWAEALDKKYEAIALLQPTSPFIKAAHLREAVKVLDGEAEADSIIAVREVRPNTIYVQEKQKYLTEIVSRISLSGSLRRQELSTQITPSGGVYLARWQAFKEKGRFYTPQALAFLLPELDSVDIDEPLDWDWAEFLLAKGVIDIPELFR